MVDALAVAEAAFPGQVTALEGEGQLNRAVRVGDELVVRVPRHRYGIERLAFEVRLLEAVRPHIDAVALPEIVEVALDRPAGRAFVAHRRIPGVVLRAELIDSLRPDVLAAAGRRVGNFLRQLHPLVTEARSVGTREASPETFAAELANELDRDVASRVPSEAFDALRRDLEGLARLPAEPLLLCHTDLGGNVVVDDRDGQVGVIDFGSCFLSHPALDVASLSVLGSAFVAACAEAYPLLGTLDPEAAAVRRTFLLQDALYGARQEDWDYVIDTVRGYH